MKVYSLALSERADADLAQLYLSEPKAYEKAMRLLEQIVQSPHSGIGKPEALRGNMSGLWSRRITQKHRLVYSVNEEEVLVLVLRAWGHYDDK